MALDDLVEEDESEVDGILKKAWRGMKSAANMGLTALGCYGVAGVNAFVLPSAFSTGYLITGLRNKKKITRKGLKSEFYTGSLLSTIHSLVYKAMTAIPLTGLPGILAKSAAVLAYSWSYVAMQQGLSYLTTKYRLREFWSNYRRKGTIGMLKEIYENRYKGRYLGIIKRTYKNIGLPLALNINFMPKEYSVAGSAAIGTAYRVLSERKD